MPTAASAIYRLAIPNGGDAGSVSASGRGLTTQQFVRLAGTDRAARAAASGVVWGWWGTNKGSKGGKYLYGLTEKRVFNRGGVHGFGAFAVRPLMFTRQVTKDSFGSWRALYVKVEYRLSEWRQTTYGGSGWSVRSLAFVGAANQSANLVSGDGKPYAGDGVGLNPSWRVGGPLPALQKRAGPRPGL